MEKYVCKICGYVYDPEIGEENGESVPSVAAGTDFADIPDEWVCPLCGVKKNFFEVVGE